MASLLHKIIFRWFASKKPTSLMHLADISQVTVLLDGGAPDAAATGQKVKEFFAAKGIQLVIVPVFKKRALRVCRDTQVLVSLVPWQNFPLEYALRRSKARFKIGRMQIPGDVLDLVVSDPENEHYPQNEVFSRMMEIVESLQ